MTIVERLERIEKLLGLDQTASAAAKCGTCGDLKSVWLCPCGSAWRTAPDDACEQCGALDSIKRTLCPDCHVDPRPEPLPEPFATERVRRIAQKYSASSDDPGHPESLKAENQRLRELLREASEDNLGGTPDLFAPRPDGWDSWFDRVAHMASRPEYYTQLSIDIARDDAVSALAMIQEILRRLAIAETVIRERNSA